VGLTYTEQPKLTFQKDPETGEDRNDLPAVPTTEYEYKAEGRAASLALMGQMKDWAQTSLQQAYNRERKYGVEALTNDLGNPVRVLGNQVDQYRARGFGQKANTAA
jgi:hypothetical protein